jgi:glutamate decarboxylase
MQLLQTVQSLLIPFIRWADEKNTNADDKTKDMVLVAYHPPQHLPHLFGFQLPECGLGKEGLLNTLSQILRYSVNTWDQGFMDKLYSTTNAVSVSTFW